MSLPRSALLGVLLLGLAASAAPGATGQPASYIQAEAKWAVDHEMVLDRETGRADMGVEILVTAKDVVCAQPMEYVVNIVPGAFAKWAGASMVPKQATGFVFHAGAITSESKSQGSPNPSVRLDIAWDTEGAPRTDARQEYTLRLELKPSQAKTGPCVGLDGRSPPPFVYKTPPPMRVTMPDYVAPEPTSVQERCESDPFSADCATLSPPPEPPTVPALDPWVLVAAAVGVLALLRRRS